MTKKKSNLSSIGNILNNERDIGKKPSSLSDFLSDSPEGAVDKKQSSTAPESKSKKVRENLSLYKEDVELIDQLILSCSIAGQKSTKTDIYRAAIKHMSKLSPEDVAKSVKEIRAVKKTHN
ncbi:MAG: hypothetical protein P1U74_10765 [Legionellaceae bacterium]|nr:hypothetical protein [Legionellaceae bacterium]